MKSLDEFSLDRIFKDAKRHKEIAQIVSRYLRNKTDIREQAFDNLYLSHARDILDLGCGFGFFTEALKDKVHSEAKVTGIDRFPEYEWFYFQSCEKAGIKADFRSNGSELVNKFEDNSFDLILCSYALYFFPEVIPQLSRLLRKKGTLIAITHSVPHMLEFTTYIRNILKENGLILTIDMPYETLISGFSNLNGKAELQKYFNEVEAKDYIASLYFGRNDHEDLASYFNFKHSFFIPEIIDPDDKLHNIVRARIKKDLLARNGLEIGKNDIIFVCTQPINTYEQK